MTDRPPVVLPMSEAPLRLPSEEAAIIRAAVLSLQRAVTPYPYFPAKTWAEAGPVVARLIHDPLQFTLPQMQAVFEAAAGRKLTQRVFDLNFKAKFPGLVNTGNKTKPKGRGAGRPATVYAMRPEHWAIPETSPYD